MCMSRKRNCSPTINCKFQLFRSFQARPWAPAEPALATDSGQRQLAAGGPRPPAAPARDARVPFAARALVSYAALFTLFPVQISHR